MRSIALLGTSLMAAGTIGFASPAQTTSSASGAGPDRAPVAFRSAADLVALNVVVMDGKQHVVGGLGASDFLVMEDGVPQEVSFFAAADVPLDLALLLDTSASMGGQMDTVRVAARGFVRAVRGIDRVMVVDIKRATRILHPLSADVPGAIAAIDDTEPSGSTGLYNGLYVTFRELARVRVSNTEEIRRQAVVVLSDGRDTASGLSFDDVMDIARDAGVATYTINLQSGAVAPTSASRVLTHWEYSLKELALETGAQAYFPEHVRDLEGVYGHIASELSSQYAIAYVSKAERLTGSFRRITVAVADRPALRARTRSGYTPRQAG